MELRDYLRVLRQNWILIVALTLLGIAVAAVYSIVQTPTYSTSAKVFVSTSGGASVTELQQGNTFTQQRVKTYADVATTPIVLLPVIDELGLDMTNHELAAEVTATAPLDTSLIEITVVDVDPARAAEIATAVSQSLTRVVEVIEAPPGAEEEGVPSPVRLTLVQHAEVPQTPESPDVLLNIALGALVGLVLGIGIAVLRTALDTRVRGRQDVEEFGVPVIGGIAYDAKAKDRPLIVHADPHSPRAESFRTLRTNLQYLEPGRADRGFVMTSSVEGEGKTTTAVNLAIALADAGIRVLLVEADLRRPKVASYLGIEGAVGLSEVLVGRVPLADAVQRWGRQQLHVLPSGRIPPNPSELLGSAAMVALVGTLKSQFDVVLYDAPPLLPVTDAAVLARIVGSAIVVVAVGRTGRQQVRGALAALAGVDAPVAGLMLNMLPAKAADTYGYSNAGYGYAPTAGSGSGPVSGAAAPEAGVARTTATATATERAAAQ